MTKKEDTPTKFWREWLNADELERIELLKKTMIVKELSEYMLIKFKDAKLGKKYVLNYAARSFNDYLQDLEMTIKS
jgi:hypothetical protein